MIFKIPAAPNYIVMVSDRTTPKRAQRRFRVKWGLTIRPYKRFRVHNPWPLQTTMRV
jgi:hypothetical protein